MELPTLRELSPQSCSILVRVQPAAKRSGLDGEWNGRLKIAVRAPADDGRANAEMIEVLAAALGLKRNQLALISGAKHRHKEVSIEQPIELVRRRLSEHSTQP